MRFQPGTRSGRFLARDAARPDGWPPLRIRRRPNSFLPGLPPAPSRNRKRSTARAWAARNPSSRPAGASRAAAAMTKTIADATRSGPPATSSRSTPKAAARIQRRSARRRAERDGTRLEDAVGCVRVGVAPSAARFLRRFALAPAVELHLHLEGAISGAALVRLSSRTPSPIFPDLASVRARRRLLGSPGAFFAFYRDVCRQIRSAADYALVARALTARLARERIRHAEVYVSPAVAERLGLDWFAVRDGARGGLRGARGRAARAHPRPPRRRPALGPRVGRARSRPPRARPLAARGRVRPRRRGGCLPRARLRRGVPPRAPPRPHAGRARGRVGGARLRRRDARAARARAARPRDPRGGGSRAAPPARAARRRLRRLPDVEPRDRRRAARVRRTRSAPSSPRASPSRSRRTTPACSGRRSSGSSGASRDGERPARSSSPARARPVTPRPGPSRTARGSARRSRPR